MSIPSNGPSSWLIQIHEQNSIDYRTASTESKLLHVESENRRVRSDEFNSEALGKLLNGTHESLKTIVGTPEVDALITSLQSEEGVLGARMMGGGLVV